MRAVNIKRESLGTLFALSCAMWCALYYSACAEERQYKVETAFLYNFFNYITWPGYGSTQELQKPVICIDENDPIMPYLEYTRSKMAGERAFTIRSISENETPKGCHIFFMRHHISSHLLASLPTNTLTVLKPDDPLDRGGMIELSEDEERISIKIDQPQLEQNGFQVSSRLLDLARR